VLELFLPPLRERPEDIELLAEMFLKQSARLNRKPVSRITPEALRLLQNYPWPGNIRELINTMERSVIITHDDSLKPADLSPAVAHFNPSASSGPGFQNLDEIEKQHIQNVLLHTASLDEAARVLGIDPATLWRKRKKYQLE
jgi:NtrC-family two-component system response regulator AlgB